MKIKNKIISAAVVFSTLIAYSCKDSFLDQAPLGAISEVSLANSAGVNGSLINAYRTLTGSNIGNWYTSPMNWAWGGVRADDSYKGSESSDQGPQLNPVERYELLPDNTSARDKWTACYDGVGMCNVTLRLLKGAKDISATDAKTIEAQARFLRGYHHFEARRCFKNVPFVDEKAVSSSDFQSLKNDADIYPQIETEVKFAFDNLPATQSQLGRVNKWAAGALLGKIYLYQGKFAEAKAMFDQVLTNGVTNKNEKYGLIDNFQDIFKGDFENGKESIFAVQYTVGDGTGGANSNKDAELTNPHNDGPGGCCGFYQPSQTFANSFKTDANGLPLLTTFNNSDVKQQENNPDIKDKDGKIVTKGDFPDNGQFDPRIDWSIGRVGVPYLDFGMALPSWIRNSPNGGPFIPKKFIQFKSEVGKYYIGGGWGQAQSGKNIYIMRTADLLLMAAEAEIEVGDMNKARDYVNQVRKRAASPTGMVMNLANTAPAGNYMIKQYTAPWTDKAVARLATRHERLIELGMEGHRFFDLVRWGIADQVLNAYLAKEVISRSHLKDAKFTKGKDEYLPIPQNVIDQGVGNLKQNPGF